MLRVHMCVCARTLLDASSAKIINGRKWHVYGARLCRRTRRVTTRQRRSVVHMSVEVLRLLAPSV